MTTATSGATFCSRSRHGRPSSSGTRRSRSTTSGDVSRTAGTTWLPTETSCTISKSCASASARRTAASISRWSSATSTRRVFTAAVLSCSRGSKLSEHPRAAARPRPPFERSRSAGLAGGLRLSSAFQELGNEDRSPHRRLDRAERRHRIVPRLLPAEEVLSAERDRERLVRIDGADEPDERGQAVQRDVGVHVGLDSPGERAEVADRAYRIELVRHRAQEAAMARHPCVVARVLARADVGERLAAVEAVRPAGHHVDLRLRLAPGRPCHLVAESLLGDDLDAAERVDEVGEAEEVDEGVVVDADAEQRRDRLLQVPGARLTAARAAVEGIDRLLERRPLRPERDLGEIAGNAERGGAAAAVLDRREDDRVGAGAEVARPLVGAEQEDRRPGLRHRPLRACEDARVGLERRHLAGAEPLDERPFPHVLRHPFGQRHDPVREQERAAVAGCAARLLLREDAREHLVAADRHPRRGDVGHRREHDEGGDEDGKRAAGGVDDGEDAEGEQCEIGQEDDRYDPAVYARERVQREPGSDDQSGYDDRHRDGHKDEPTPRGSSVQLAQSGDDRRQEAGDDHRPSVCAALDCIPPRGPCSLTVAGCSGSPCWRPCVPRSRCSRSGSAGRRPASPTTPTGGLAAAVILKIESQAPAGAVGWPLVLSIPLLPFRVIGWIDDEVAVGVGVAVAILANAATIFITAFIGWRVAGSRRVGLLAASVFAFWPFLVWLLFGERTWTNSAWAIEAGLELYTEPVSTACVAAGTALALVRGRPPWAAVAAGITLGYAIAVRPTNLVFAAAVAILFAWERDWRSAGRFVAGGLTVLPIVLAFLPKKRGYDLALARDETGLPLWSNDYLITTFTEASVWRPLLLALLLPLVLLGVASVRSRPVALMLLGGALANAAVYAFFRATFEHPRYLHAGLPALLVLWAAGAARVAELARRRSSSPQPVRSS